MESRLKIWLIGISFDGYPLELLQASLFIPASTILTFGDSKNSEISNESNSFTGVDELTNSIRYGMFISCFTINKYMYLLLILKANCMHSFLFNLHSRILNS